jgi:hypothetical protein
MFWKDDWNSARQNLQAWWRCEGLAVSVTAPKAEPWEDIPPPPSPASLKQQWLDPDWRAQSQTHRLARTFFGGEAFPLYSCDIGPGSLGTFIGARPHLMPTTVWYESCIADPESHPPLIFDEEQEWFRKHVALIEKAASIADGRFLVGMPDLIENLDTLAALRGTREVLMDLRDRPGWVRDRLWEINEVFFAAFDVLRGMIRDPDGGNAFGAFQLWGSGKTAKVQCDIAALMSPADFAEFVLPPLADQCDWLDFSMFHVDGSQCIPIIDHLLEIDSLNAIEFTPEPRVPGGGSPHWYELYRRIIDAGKGVQAVGVRLDEVEPLLDAVGGRGMFIIGPGAPTEAEARAALERIEQYR